MLDGKEYYVLADVREEVESYGYDADGNRGEERTFIDYEILSVEDETGNRIGYQSVSKLEDLIDKIITSSE